MIRTSLPKDKIGPEAAVAAYKSLALVERAFRTLKGVDLAVRPVFHWLDHRVKAHVFLCMLPQDQGSTAESCHKLKCSQRPD